MDEKKCPYTLKISPWFSLNPKPERLAEELGKRYEVMFTNIKKFAVGSPIQAPLDAILLLMEKHGFAAKDVESIVVRLPAGGVSGRNVVHNRDMPDINLQHILAVALLDGDLTFEAAHSYERMKDPAVLEIRKRVKSLEDPGLDISVTARQSIVEVTTKKGDTFKEHVIGVRGTAQNPMTVGEIEKKCNELLKPVLGQDDPSRPPSTRRCSSASSPSPPRDTATSCLRRRWLARSPYSRRSSASSTPPSSFPGSSRSCREPTRCRRDRTRRETRAAVREESTAMDALLKESRHNPILWLLAFVPVVLAGQKIKPEAHTLLFVLSVLANVPLATLLSHATESVAAKTGDTVGGLLNATLGNLTELFIALAALRAGEYMLVKAYIAGAIVGNTLFMLALHTRGYFLRSKP